MAAKYYVYQLEDQGVPFYVGKGCGDRIAAHERDARLGIDSAKCNKIRQIWAGGRKVERRQIAYFFNEGDAYQFESERIKEIGLENLTNSPMAEIVANKKKKAKRNKYLSDDFFKVAAFWIRISLGKQKEPSEQRPFARAIHNIIKSRGHQEFMAKAIKSIGMDAFRDGLRRHGIEVVPA